VRRTTVLYFLIALLCGCVTASRDTATTALTFDELTVSGFSQDVRSLNPDHDTFLAAINDRILRSRPGANDGTLDFLALSGGGAGGAFGAGAIVGLTQSGRRPVFEVVTGVSTGALIAPFAFLGPEWDEELERAYSGGAADNITRTLGLSSLFRLGVLDASRLRELVEGFVTPELIEAVAAAHLSGRTLLVATTYLDAETPVYWDLGKVAQSRDEESRRLFVDILTASASIPGAFAPVLIRSEGLAGRYDELHVDGGVTVPFFFFPEIAFLSNARLSALRGANLYTIINGQLDPAFRVSQANALTIAVRAFNVALTRMARTELLLTSQFSRLHGLTSRFTYIPTEFSFNGAFDFSAESMGSLFAYGRACAAAGRLWLTEADVRDQTGSSGRKASEAPACPAGRMR
jgi:hypothetical protein